MFRRSKTKLEDKDKKPLENSGQKSAKNEKSAGLGKFLGVKKKQKDKSETSQIDTVESDEEKNESGIEFEGENKDKISTLIKYIKSSNEKLVAPKLDLKTGNFAFPLLKKIGENEKNIQFLENLTTQSIDILEKSVFERIAVCPQHPNSLEANMRLYCPKCRSMDIEKLHLFEHRACGYISETKNFGSANESLLECPSCKKPITDQTKELRIPAMWYSCVSCKEKFDDVVIKMHCRKFNHDFDTNMAGTVSIPCFKLKDTTLNADYDSLLINNIKDLLKEHEFISEENHSLKGKSGHYHNIDLIATNSNTDTIFTFILKSGNEIAESEINSKIIQVLDCTPSKTVIIGHLSNKAKSIASRYDISVIDSLEKDIVLPSFSKILTESFETESLATERQRVEKERKDAERLAEREKLEEETLETERNEAKTLEAEILSQKQRLEEDRKEAERLEAERLVERKRLEEEIKKVERIEAERLVERKRLEAERLTERKKLKEESFAERLKLEAERQRLRNERKKVEKLEAERQRLHGERKKVENLEAEKLESKRKRLAAERKQAEKREKILKKLEETENQLKSLKSSFDSNDEEEK